MRRTIEAGHIGASVVGCHLHLLHVAVATAISAAIASAISNAQHRDSGSEFAPTKGDHVFSDVSANDVTTRRIGIDEDVLDKVVAVLCSWSAL